MNKNELDEIAEEIVDMILSSKKLSTHPSLESRQNFAGEVEKLKKRVDGMEKQLQKYIDSFKIAAVEAERHITENFEEQEKEREKTLMMLIEQIENLKAEMRNVKFRLAEIKKH